MELHGVALDKRTMHDTMVVLHKIRGLFSQAAFHKAVDIVLAHNREHLVNDIPAYGLRARWVMQTMTTPEIKTRFVNTIANQMVPDKTMTLEKISSLYFKLEDFGKEAIFYAMEFPAGRALGWGAVVYPLVFDLAEASPDIASFKSSIFKLNREFPHLEQVRLADLKKDAGEPQAIEAAL